MTEPHVTGPPDDDFASTKLKHRTAKRGKDSNKPCILQLYHNFKATRRRNRKFLRKLATRFRKAGKVRLAFRADHKLIIIFSSILIFNYEVTFSLLLQHRERLRRECFLPY